MAGFIAMKFVTNFLIVLLLSFNARADFSGNFKSYPIVQDFPQLKEVQEVWQNSLKIQSQNTFHDKYKTEIAYELTATYERPIPRIDLSNNYRITDLNTFVHDPAYDFQYYGTLVTQNLNRINLSFSTEIADFTIGRQPIAFGSAKSINPTDVISPFNLNAIDKEDRNGVDALVMKLPLNPSTLIEFGTVAGKKYSSSTSAFYIRPKITLDKNEFNLMFMKFKNRDLFGFDLQRPIYDAGSWLEAAVIKEPNYTIKNFVRATAGVDYKFKNTLYFAGEYHYNGAGSKSGIGNIEDFIFLHHYHYGIISTTYELTPLLISSLQTYFSFYDNSDFTLFKLDYNFSDNLYFSIGTYLGIGHSFNSEFGSMGKVYFTSVRYYF